MRVSNQNGDVATRGRGANGAQGEQFRELMAHLEQVFWIRNTADDAFLYISPAYERVFGRSCQSLYDHVDTFLDAIHPEDRERMGRAFAGQVESGGFEEEYRIVRPDGETRWIWARSYPVSDGHGRVRRFAGIAEDITDRKALDLDHARLAAIVEYAEDAMVSMTLDGIIIAWNYGAERQYGYTDTEMIGRPISVLFPPDHYAEYREVMAKVRTGEAMPAYNSVRLRKDGTLINISISISPIETLEGEAVGASKIAHDLTSAKQMEEQFRQAQKMQAMGRLAAGVAHDFNNLITVISGYSSLLLTELPPGAPTRAMVEQVQAAGERAASLTQQLLLFSRKHTLDLQAVDLNSVVTDGTAMFARLLGSGVKLVTVLEPMLLRVQTDRRQMDQVLMNLIINAGDAMPDGGTLTVETANAVVDEAIVSEHGRLLSGRYSMLMVRDTGCGMDAQTKKHVFEPFFTTKEAGDGTGLGLAMVQGFVTQCGGQVFVRSDPDMGSTFTVYLPKAEDPAAPRAPDNVGLPQEFASNR